jgi:iron complex outermembrane receptor protein
MRRTVSLLALAVALLPSPLLAQSAVNDPSSDEPGSNSDQGPVPGNATDAHPEHEQDIVVTGVRRKENDVLGGVSVLDAADLTRQVRPSIGETLAKQPGVSATSFGPTASAPVLRGLSGDRVRVLTDGIGTLDLSSSGPDHAIAINPITAERIEVLRGPSALLFGSSAIGGVVNVIDTRIPRHSPDGPVEADALLAYGSAANERSINAAFDLPVVGHFILHADGNWSKSDDLETGGHILSKE